MDPAGAKEHLSEGLDQLFHFVGGQDCPRVIVLKVDLHVLLNVAPPQW